MDFCSNATTSIDTLCFVGLQIHSIMWGVIVGGVVGLLTCIFNNKN